ncbi:MAG: response regulator receiver protein [Marine Group I thaumarchaeote]|nr:MAG: response regulator receiver protein [Marine Group I thaumarchaeote]
MKILLIDDNESITKSLSKYLGLKNYDCTVSNDGRNGLSLIQKNKFDVVLLDLSMPEFSGIDVLEALEKDGLLKKQKIILFTASSITQEEIERLLKTGIHGCIRKPVRMPDLLKFLNDE